jgi:hypothetical protein
VLTLTFWKDPSRRKSSLKNNEAGVRFTVGLRFELAFSLGMRVKASQNKMKVVLSLLLFLTPSVFCSVGSAFDCDTDAIDEANVWCSSLNNHTCLLDCLEYREADVTLSLLFDDCITGDIDSTIILRVQSLQSLVQCRAQTYLVAEPLNANVLGCFGPDCVPCVPGNVLLPNGTSYGWICREEPTSIPTTQPPTSIPSSSPTSTPTTQAPTTQPPTSIPSSSPTSTPTTKEPTTPPTTLNPTMLPTCQVDLVSPVAFCSLLAGHTCYDECLQYQEYANPWIQDYTCMGIHPSTSLLYHQVNLYMNTVFIPCRIAAGLVIDPLNSNTLASGGTVNPVTLSPTSQPTNLPVLGGIAPPRLNNSKMLQEFTAFTSQVLSNPNITTLNEITLNLRFAP